MGDRVPGKAVEAGRLEVEACRTETMMLARQHRAKYLYMEAADEAERVLSAALDACPVIGLLQEELDALLHPEPWAVKNRARHAALSKLRAALRSVLEANGA